ncbi:MAG: transketolase [Gammaproteobacteria bacterium]
MTQQTAAVNVLERGRPVSTEELRARAMSVRLETIRLNGIAGIGHYSSVLSCAEILATLYYRTLRLKRGDPAWPLRDRFLLGKGHVAVGLWSILADMEFFPRAWLEGFGQLHQPLTDHPNMRWVPGIDFSSGSLGHNLSVGAGMAIAGRMRGQDYRTFVLTGDGELHEGQIWEAFMAGSHYRLGNLVAIVDANGSCGDGEISTVMNIEPLAARIAAFGWRAVEVDGHDVGALARAFDTLPPPESEQPSCIIARTRKGRGVSFMEAAPRRWHLAALGPEDRARAIAEIERGLP